MEDQTNKLLSLRRLILGPLYDQCKVNGSQVSREQLQQRLTDLQTGEHPCLSECSVDQLVELCEFKRKEELEIPDCFMNNDQGETEKNCVEQKDRIDPNNVPESAHDWKFKYLLSKRFMENDYTCSICYDQYDDFEQSTISLPCKHHVHMSCIIQAAHGNSREYLQCPECRAEFIFPMMEQNANVRANRRERQNIRNMHIINEDLLRTYYTADDLLNRVQLPRSEIPLLMLRYPHIPGMYLLQANPEYYVLDTVSHTVRIVNPDLVIDENTPFREPQISEIETGVVSDIEQAEGRSEIDIVPENIVLRSDEDEDQNPNDNDTEMMMDIQYQHQDTPVRQRRQRNDEDDETPVRDTPVRQRRQRHDEDDETPVRQRRRIDTPVSLPVILNRRHQREEEEENDNPTRRLTYEDEEVENSDVPRTPENRRGRDIHSDVVPPRLRLSRTRQMENHPNPRVNRRLNYD
jgi:hypothetical protein